MTDGSGASTCYKDPGFDDGSSDKKKRTAPRAPSMSRKTSMALAAAPSAAPARTAPPACIPARAAKVARTPRRVVPLSALTILRSALQALS